jgi:hypothetical protein
MRQAEGTRHFNTDGTRIMVKTKETNSPPAADSPAASPAQTAPPRRRGKGRLILVLLGVVALLLFFAPTLAARYCQSEAGLAWITGQPPGRIAISQISLGWQSPVLLSGIVIQGEEDNGPLAQVDSVTTGNTLWDMLVRPDAPLQLNLDGLHLTAVVKEPGQSTGEFNLRDVVNTLADLKIPVPSRAMELKFTNTSIEFRTPQQQILDTWTGIAGEYQYLAGAEPSQHAVATLPENAERQTGPLSLTGDWKISQGENAGETLNLDVSADRTSLQGVQPWLQQYLGSEQSIHSLSGQLQARFVRTPDASWTLTATSNLNDAARPETRLQLAVDGHYSRASDDLTLSKFDLNALGAAASLQGSIARLSQDQMFNIRGNLQSPGAPLMELLPASLRQELQVSGITLSELQLQGALHPPADQPAQPFTASMLVNWQSAQGYGLTSQNGQLRLQYQNGLLIPEPVHVPINGGTLRQLPTVSLQSQPVILQFREGPVLENVALTEEVCRGWLQYISPPLANATSAEGRFSLSMKEGQYLVGAPERSALSGALVIHIGKVRPGPLANQILQNVTQLQGLIDRNLIPDLSQQTLLEIDNEEIGFALQNGRVYHDEFAMQIRNMRVVTTGSVGLDQTLDLAVALPIPDQWLKNAGPVLQALRGEAIQLAVRGTLSQPVVDGRPVAEFGKRIGEKAASGLIERLIERRLQRNK